MRESKQSSSDECKAVRSKPKGKQSFFRRLGKRTILILAVLFLSAGLELLWSNYHIVLAKYEVATDKLTATIRIVFLSDLHGREFGRGNTRLLERIKSQNPDLILLVGDFFDRDAGDEAFDAMCSFLSQCTQIAPVYFSLGNHEQELVQTRGEVLIERITSSGAILLDNQYVDTVIHGAKIRIGGYMGYFGQPHMMTKDPDQIRLERSFFGEFKDTDCFKLLLNHIPTSWLDWDYIDNDAVDLVLSGHYHGGVVRIPILEQGLYAPYVGKFPPYTKGMFIGKKAICILTTGLAGSYGIPRFFNPPEICVVELRPVDINAPVGDNGAEDGD